MDWKTLAEVRSRHSQALLELESIRAARAERTAMSDNPQATHDLFNEAIEGAVKRVTSWSKLAQHATLLKSEEDQNGH